MTPRPPCGFPADLRLGWLGRLALALVFVLGTVTSAGGSRPSEVEGELTMERGEESKPLASGSLAVREVRMARRLPTHGRGARRRELAGLRAPTLLSARAPEPPRPSWARPRRVPPDDEDAALA